MIDPRLQQLIDRALDYRGYVTISRRDGTQRVGFVYARGEDHVEMFDEAAASRIRIEVDEIADLALTGPDAAAAAQRIWERRSGALEPAEAPAGDPREPAGSASAAAGPRRHHRRAGRGASPVLILVALPIELRGVARVLGAPVQGDAVRGRLGEGRAVALAVGIGGGAARAIAEERPRLVISCGFAGALDPSLSSGDLILASSVRDENGEALAALEPLLRTAREALTRTGGARVVEGELLCATRVVATADAKRALAQPGRRALDLESWPVAHAAHRTRTPWLALRVVLDKLATDLPAFTGEPRASYVGPAMRHALGGPRPAADLARLWLRARTASRALRRGLHDLGPALGAWSPSEPGA